MRDHLFRLVTARTKSCGNIFSSNPTRYNSMPAAISKVYGSLLYDKAVSSVLHC
jgi:hypothetical protein